MYDQICSKKLFFFSYISDINYGDLVATIPFENTLDTMELRGDYLLQALEYSVTKSWDEDRFNPANMLVFSG